MAERQSNGAKGLAPRTLMGVSGHLDLGGEV